MTYRFFPLQTFQSAYFLSEMSVRLPFRIRSCQPSVFNCECVISTKKLIHLSSTQVWLMTHWLGFTKGKSCLTNLISFYHKVTHLESTKRRQWKYFFWIMLLILPLTASSWTSFELWDKQIHSALGEEVAGGQSSNGCSHWSCIWLVMGHQWCSSGLSSRVQCIYIMVQEVHAPLANLLMLLNWQMLLTLLRDERPCKRMWIDWSTEQI